MIICKSNTGRSVGAVKRNFFVSRSLYFTCHHLKGQMIAFPLGGAMADPENNLNIIEFRDSYRLKSLNGQLGG
jgi:hypothetical protein